MAALMGSSRQVVREAIPTGEKKQLGLMNRMVITRTGMTLGFRSENRKPGYSWDWILQNGFWNGNVQH